MVQETGADMMKLVLRHCAQERKKAMRLVNIGNVRVSGLCIGGNPFSGFSHQSQERDREMLAYYTAEQIKDVLRQSEEAGINTLFARTDEHILGIVTEYWREGGKIQWFAQVRGEPDRPESWRDWLRRSVEAGAVACYMHGGETDFWFANGMHDHLREALGMMRAGGVAAGFAGHQPAVHAWIRDNLQVDFQMCSYYNPTDRSKNAQHQSVGEKWDDADVERMLAVIRTINAPVVHYKVLAAGNKPFQSAFERLGQTMRPRDVVCLGMFLKDDPEMIRRNVALFERIVEGVAAQ